MCVLVGAMLQSLRRCLPTCGRVTPSDAVQPRAQASSDAVRDSFADLASGGADDGEDDDDDDACSVCLESLRAGGACATACGHRFHIACLEAWDGRCVAKPFFCPMCRTLLVSMNALAEERRRRYAQEVAERFSELLIIRDAVMRMQEHHDRVLDGSDEDEA